MSSIARPIPEAGSAGDAFPLEGTATAGGRWNSPWASALRSGRVVVGGGALLLVVLICLATLPWTLGGTPAPYEAQSSDAVRRGPDKSAAIAWMGYDALGRSLFARCLLGGAISLAVGVAAAAISVVVGVTVGLFAGYRGGWVDSALMRTVDVLYGLPYILLVILFKIAFEGPLVDGVSGLTLAGIVMMLGGLSASLVVFTLRVLAARILVGIFAGIFILTGILLLLYAATRTGPPLPPALKLSAATANLVVLFSAIGLVSWLTMARVVRGQVLSLRAQPFVEACRAMGLPERRIFLRHMLPNLVGPITVYATLTVPQAILQESFLSFLGVGVSPPLPTWGSLAGDAIQSLSPIRFYWWLLVFPCTLLAITLLSLNFLGDGLRDLFDPKREAAKI